MKNYSKEYDVHQRVQDYPIFKYYSMSHAGLSIHGYSKEDPDSLQRRAEDSAKTQAEYRVFQEEMGRKYGIKYSNDVVLEVKETSQKYDFDLAPNFHLKSAKLRKKYPAVFACEKQSSAMKLRHDRVAREQHRDFDKDSEALKQDLLYAVMLPHNHWGLKDEGTVYDILEIKDRYGDQYLQLRMMAIKLMTKDDQIKFHVSNKTKIAQIPHAKGPFKFNRGDFKIACEVMNLDPAKIKKNDPNAREISSALIAMGSRNLEKEMFVSRIMVLKNCDGPTAKAYIKSFAGKTWIKQDTTAFQFKQFTSKQQEQFKKTHGLDKFNKLFKEAYGFSSSTEKYVPGTLELVKPKAPDPVKEKIYLTNPDDILPYYWSGDIMTPKGEMYQREIDISKSLIKLNVANNKRVIFTKRFFIHPQELKDVKHMMIYANMRLVHRFMNDHGIIRNWADMSD